MKGALVLSMVVKALGAVLEIASQVVITRFGGVDLFGHYSFNVSIAEIICWVFFSGLVKTNAYWVANGYDLRGWRRRYFLLYALPVVIILAASLGLIYSAIAVVAVAAAFGYALQMDFSSISLAFKHYRFFLTGEYVVSRLVILIGVVLLVATGLLNIATVTVLYALGYVASVSFFIAGGKGSEDGLKKLAKSKERSLVRQTAVFQATDVANGLVNQAPIIIQYAFAGAFQAGVLSVVLVTRKIISFVAGPTAKVYLPEFAKLYGERDYDGLKRVYSDIIILQLCFVLPICLVMVGAPESILAIYNPTLKDYGSYMQFASCIFFLMVLFGPQGNLLSMTGAERIEATTKWVSLVAMVLTMAVTFGDPLFVMYGIAAQVVVDSFGKLWFVSKAVGGFPIGVKDALKLSLPFAICLLIVGLSGFSSIQRLLLAAVLAAVLCAFLIVLFYRDEIVARLARSGK